MSEKWFEVFRAGKYPQGDVSTADLDEIVRSFDPKTLEVPAVIGHPKLSSPAYGWVGAVKRGGDKLLVQFRKVSDGLKKAIKEESYRRVSIRIRREDGKPVRLLHVGFLGAQAPAVEGLEPIEFNDQDGLDVEADFNVQEEKRTMELTQQQLDEAIATAVRNAVAAKDQQFAAEKARMEQELAAERTQTARQKIEAGLAKRVGEGKLAPAMVALGLADFCLSLEDGQGALEVEFAAGDTKAKVTQGKWFEQFLDQLPKVVDFKEAAGRDTDPDEGSPGTTDFVAAKGAATAESLELRRKAKAYQAKHQCDFKTAVRAVTLG